MEDNLKKKMEDNLKKNKMEDDLKKNGRPSPKKMEDLNKNWKMNSTINEKDRRPQI
jgi:hypothetical protein